MTTKPGLLPDDEDTRALEQAWAIANSEVGNQVTRALQRGLPQRHIAVVVERNAAGDVKAICSTRYTVAKKTEDLHAHSEALRVMTDVDREAMARALLAVPPEALPVVVLAHRQTHWACAIRTERPEIVPLQ